MTEPTKPSANRLRFRAWHIEEKEMGKVKTLELDNEGNVVSCEIELYSEKRGYSYLTEDLFMKEPTAILMQSTGLTDKSNPCKEVFEGDIISLYGKVIGNQWESPALLEGKANFLIEGFGTEGWITTHQESMARGLHYPKRHAN